MQRFITGFLITVGVILLFAVGFSVYAQFALDYSLESLKEALEASRRVRASGPDAQAYSSTLEGLVLDEVTRPDADFGSVVFLEHARRSVGDAVEKSGYARAGVYLSEVLKEKAARRNWFFQLTDAVYDFIRSFVQNTAQLWNYVLKRFEHAPSASPLEGTGMLILGEAERKEKAGEFEEAAGYYREFLDRFSDRPERGFVTLALAHVLIKMRRLEDAQGLLEEVQEEFPGSREEALAKDLLFRIRSIQKRLARVPELEDWIREEPERIFKEEGGLQLALDYIATFQLDRAQSVLKKLEEAPDPRIRSKALFYKGILHKWEGDLLEGKEIFQTLGETPGVEEELALAAKAQLADVYYQDKDYEAAVSQYQEFSGERGEGAWGALSELEQSEIYLFRIGNAERALERLEKLKAQLPNMSPQVRWAGERLREALQKSLREEGLRAFAASPTDEALEIFKRQLDRFPGDARVYSVLATLLVLRNRFEEALENAEKGYGLEQSEYTSAVLAYVYEKIGRLKEAEKYYSISTEITPSYLIARFNLAVIHLVTGRYREADELLAELERMVPAPAEIIRAKILNNRGCAFWGLGKKEEARAAFQKALEAMPDLQEAVANLKLGVGQEPITVSTETPLLR